MNDTNTIFRLPTLKLPVSLSPPPSRPAHHDNASPLDIRDDGQPRLPAPRPLAALVVWPVRKGQSVRTDDIIVFDSFSPFPLAESPVSSLDRVSRCARRTPQLFFATLCPALSRLPRMAQQQTVMPQEMMQQPPPPHPQAMHPPINSYYPDNNNDLTGGLPINLDSLRDGPPGSKPFYPYSTLIRYVP